MLQYKTTPGKYKTDCAVNVMKIPYQDKNGFYLRYGERTLDFPPHLHNAIEMVYLTRGSCTIFDGSERHILSEGDLFLSFPHQIHGYENSQNTVRYILILPTKPYLRSFYKTLTEKLPVSPILRKGQWEHSGLPQLLQMAFQDMNTASEEVMAGYFMVIFGKLLSIMPLTDQAPGSGEALRSILRYIDDHYTEAISRRDIAKAVGYNESYISHLFKQTIKSTLSEYIYSMRVYDAAQLLMKTDLPITQVVSQLGFGSIRNFNRVFLSHTGLSPRDYRKKYASNQRTK